MKKKLTIIAGLLICLTFGTLGTLTYFTASEKADNVITTGEIKIALNEWTEDCAGNKVPFENVDGVTPGEAISKIVEIENTGSNPAWVRVSVNKDIELTDGSTTSIDTLISLDINTTDWTEKDGYYYYNSLLNAGETTEPLFTTVTFNDDMGNTYQNSNITIDIAAYATQSDNNGANVFEAAGWPEP